MRPACKSSGCSWSERNCVVTVGIIIVGFIFNQIM